MLSQQAFLFCGPCSPSGLTPQAQTTLNHFRSSTHHSLLRRASENAFPSFWIMLTIPPHPTIHSPIDSIFASILLSLNVSSDPQSRLVPPGKLVLIYVPKSLRKRDTHLPTKTQDHIYAIQSDTLQRPLAHSRHSINVLSQSRKPSNRKTMTGKLL